MNEKSKELVKFKKELAKKCKLHKIKLKLTHTPTIDCGTMPEIQVSGYFDPTLKELAVATDKDFNEWVEILIHESCHLDQYVEGIVLWKNTEQYGVDVYSLLDLWLNKIIELKPKVLNNVIKTIIDLERDCDIRTVAKIKEYGLDKYIDIDRYIQKSNAYHLSYAAVKVVRKWNKPTKAAYQVEQVLTLFTKTFSTKYTVNTEQLKNLKKYCY